MSQISQYDVVDHLHHFPFHFSHSNSTLIDSSQGCTRTDRCDARKAIESVRPSIISHVRELASRQGRTLKQGKGLHLQGGLTSLSRSYSHVGPGLVWQIQKQLLVVPQVGGQSQASLLTEETDTQPHSTSWSAAGVEYLTAPCCLSRARARRPGHSTPGYSIQLAR